jgi:hypothetical protein
MSFSYSRFPVLFTSLKVCLRRGSAIACWLGLRVGIPLRAQILSIVCCHVSEGPITRPEESYRV